MLANVRYVADLSKLLLWQRCRGCARAAGVSPQDRLLVPGPARRPADPAARLGRCFRVLRPLGSLRPGARGRGTCFDISYLAEFFFSCFEPIHFSDFCFIALFKTDRAKHDRMAKEWTKY